MHPPRCQRWVKSRNTRREQMLPLFTQHQTFGATGVRPIRPPRPPHSPPPALARVVATAPWLLMRWRAMAEVSAGLSTIASSELRCGRGDLRDQGVESLYWITVAKPACVIRVVTGLVDPSVAAASAPDDVATRLSMMACGKMRCVRPIGSTI